MYGFDVEIILSKFVFICVLYGKLIALKLTLFLALQYRMLQDRLMGGNMLRSIFQYIYLYRWWCLVGLIQECSKRYWRFFKEVFCPILPSWMQHILCKGNKDQQKFLVAD
eukprot:TRINITY_DN3340_c0_g1_i12.p4 TRINITY_DN3340_c0_g1~~TRINITY_DN3340_c0_g1_i12.p4  ORF type:complete len:110 (+),score=7.79 TRINITY_DN3340_c0_g1_i12:724-1053(+)